MAKTGDGSRDDSATELERSGRRFYRLFWAFGLAITSFFAATFYSQQAARSIGRLTADIATNAMPSIEETSVGRAELRQVEGLLRRYADRPDPVLRAQIDGARDRMETAIDTYLKLPTFPGERGRWSELRASLLALEQVVAQALDRFDRGEAVEAQRILDDRLSPAVDRTARAIQTVTEFNAAQGQRLAQAIDRARGRNDRVELLLDGLCALLTVIAAFLALHAIGGHLRLVEEGNRLQAQRADELEQFAGRVAHDILGPLTATSMALTWIEQHAEGDRQRSYASRGSRGIERVRMIVDGLLRFARAAARPEAGVHARVPDVLDEIGGDLRPFAAQAAVELLVEEPPRVAVACNRGVLMSALENLVRNAIKYMGERPVRRVTVRAVAARGQVHFEVEDTGPGIPAELRPRLFEPYVRGHQDGQPGIGLGLATVRRLAEAHGGSVGVRSTESGSAFWIELPIVEDVLPDHDGGPAPAPDAHPS